MIWERDNHVSDQSLLLMQRCRNTNALALRENPQQTNPITSPSFDQPYLEVYKSYGGSLIVVIGKSAFFKTANEGQSLKYYVLTMMIWSTMKLLT